MTQSIELLLDDATDAAVRAQWATLAAAGLPSLAGHTSASNRPHITLVAQDEIDESAEPDLRQAMGELPIEIRLGSLMVFGARRFVLVRPLVADVALLELQQRVQEIAGGARPESAAQMAPGRWVPHVTLAHRMSAAQVATALEVLTGRDEETTETAYAVSARRWDGTAKREWPLR